MRKIIFRGKGNPKYNDEEWLEGYLIKDSDGDYQIFLGGCIRRTVLSETIGQYIGLIDRNGNKIFEGDIVNILTENEEIGVIVYEDGGFIVRADKFSVDFINNINGTDVEVIGNKYDNPELLGDLDYE
jgi:uncharacterized phage protein (TIGR01671 family)|nr:MAG TPA_asm: YopX protein [Caudoviricetes sp.]